MFKSLLIFALLVSTAFGNVLPPEFLEWEGRIVGGSTAGVGQFPFIASLRTTGNSHFCGGSIINNRWVVSAAHCTQRTPASTLIVVGAHTRTDGTRLGCSRIINHPSYNPNTLNNDISILQSASTITIGGRVAIIPLGSTFLTGGTGTAIGWGQTSHPGSLAFNLQFVNKNILSEANCRSHWGTRINAAHICTFSGRGTGTCMGDSGGPLVSGGALQGAVSFGRPCAVGTADVYARVSTFRTWILNNAR